MIELTENIVIPENGKTILTVCENPRIGTRGMYKQTEYNLPKAITNVENNKILIGDV